MKRELNRARRGEAERYMRELRQNQDLTGRERFQLYREKYRMLVEQQETEDERTIGNLLSRMWARGKRA